MVRRVFFSFHYDRDIWRVNVVRNCWLTKSDRESAGFWDASLWEKTKLKGENAIKKLIDDGLKYTSVTAVLIGEETSTRKYVLYEIEQSYLRDNGILGLYINNIKDNDGRRDLKGKNPLDLRYIEKNGRRIYLSQLCHTYDWFTDNGYQNLASWVEIAARNAGR